MHYQILDALNIIHGTLELRKHLEGSPLGAMQQLVQLALPILHSPSQRIVIVYDGGSELPTPQTLSKDPQLTLIYSMKDQPADLVIKTIVHNLQQQKRNAVHSITVVSDDFGLRTIIEGMGAQGMSVRTWNEHRKQSQQQQHEHLRRLQKNSDHSWNSSLGSRLNWK